jgi:hypothetical protein
MKEEKKAVLIAFSVQSGKFESHYERNKFFRGLYGWKQTIRKEVIVGESKKPKKKFYTYQREGLLDEIPHEKVDQSSFIVPEDDAGKIMNFFKEWRDKVMWKSFKVLLDKDFEDFFKEGLEEEEELGEE